MTNNLKVGRNMPEVAIKEFRSDEIDYFYREQRTLQLIRGLNHKHLIKPVAAYEKGGSRCFVFLWAAGGNLRDFWKEMDDEQNTRLRFDAPLVNWVLNQMHGLVGALKTLHSQGCRHGDLKPENILRFTEGEGHGNLLIADVGLAKFHAVDTQMRDRRSSIPAWTLRYEPPEIYSLALEADKPLSRAYDIWCMGCTFFEFLVWLLYGQERLTEFNNAGGRDAKFWELDNGERKVHHDVQKWMKKLTIDLRENTALREILKLVKNRLLVVELAEGGQSSKQGRANADEIFSCLEHIRLMVARNTSYLLHTSNWSRTKSSNISKATLTVPGSVHGARSPMRLPTRKNSSGANPQIIVEHTDGDSDRPASDGPLQEVFLCPPRDSKRHLANAVPVCEFAREYFWIIC